MSKVIVGLCIPRIGMVITIWGKVFFKLIVYFYWLVIRNKVFLEYPLLVAYISYKMLNNIFTGRNISTSEKDTVFQ